MELEFLNFELWQYIVFAGVFFCSCFLQGVIGFGAGAFGIPILFLFVGFPLDTTIAAITIASMTQSGLGAWKLQRSIKWRSTLRPGLVRILFILPGVLLLQWLMAGDDSSVTKVVAESMADERKQMIQQMLGVILILIVVCKRYIRIDEQKELATKWEFIAFSISGVMLGFVGMGGPAVAIWVMFQPWTAKQSRGFLFAMLFYGMIPLALILAWRFGASSIDGLILGALGLPIVFIGTAVGIRIGNRLDRKKLKSYALLALFLIGLSALLRPLFTS
ncbi:MAG: sulfite exporter TauE/SafE family protein [Planctomycetaceae bacterium]|nr:sulfite exporter TauE/SafE family protein [Planctomycetaceae bacterium]MBT7256605.1 sulfite exporter TauE/SafE family protein [Planctomycetaceae bacterium]